VGLSAVENQALVDVSSTRLLIPIDGCESIRFELRAVAADSAQQNSASSPPVYRWYAVSMIGDYSTLIYGSVEHTPS
jgi:hypothetical protein